MPTHEQIIEETARLVNEGLSVTLPVNGRSMLPFIVGGQDKVILRKPDVPKIGDVVLAWVDGCRYVIHRIIRIDGENITLMGDGNLMATESCSIRDIKALATHTVDTVGKAHELYTRRRRSMARLWSFLRPIRKFLLPVLVKHQDIQN